MSACETLLKLGLSEKFDLYQIKGKSAHVIRNSTHLTLYR